MSLEKMLELNTAAVTRLADLMERFKPNAAAATVAAKGLKVELDKIAEEPAPKKKAPAKKAEVKEEPKVETMASVVQEMVDDDEKLKEAPKEEPKPEVVEEPKEVELVDIQKVARILITAGGDAKTQAKAAIETVAGKGAKIATLDKALYAEVLAALEVVQANLEEV